MPEQRAKAFIDRFLASSQRKRKGLRDEAARLAEQTHTQGVDLCMSKATEFSPRIKVLFLAAAKLARMGYGADPGKLAKFERAIRSDSASLASYKRLADRLGDD